MSQDDEHAEAPKRRAASKPLFDPKELHDLSLQAASEALGDRQIPERVAQALETYAASLRISPRAVRKAELQIDRAIADNLEALGGWDNANAVRDTYKSSLEMWIADLVDTAHARSMEGAKDSLAIPAPGMEIPDSMAADLKKMVEPALFPGKFEPHASGQLRSQAVDRAESKFVLASDDGRVSPAYHRASSTASGYKIALEKIADEVKRAAATGLG